MLVASRGARGHVGGVGAKAHGQRAQHEQCAAGASGLARQRSPRQRARATAAMISAGQRPAQQRQAGRPEFLGQRPPGHGIERETGGNEGEQEEVHGRAFANAHCRLRNRRKARIAAEAPEAPSLAAMAPQSARRLAAGRHERRQGQDEDGHSGRLTGPMRAATASGKLPAEARQAPLARAATDADVADFVRRMKELGPQTAAGRGRLRVRHGRHHEPPADLGHGAGAAGRHVPRREGRRRARRAARLFPRRRRVPRLQVGVGPRRAGGADDAVHLRRRLHADRQGAEPRAHGSAPSAASTRWSTSATAWRRRSTTCAAAPASWRCWACRCSCSRRAPTPAPSRPSARSPGSPRAPTAASMPARRRSCASCSSAVAVYAAGGRKALQALTGRGARALLQQLK